MSESRPKILIFSLAYVPFVGGAELALQEIVKRMPEYDFHLITYRFDIRWPKEEYVENIKVFRVGSGKDSSSYYGRTFEKFLYIPLALFKAIMLHRKEQYEVFWSLMASRASAPALLMKWLNPRVPFFLTIQEGDLPEYARRRAGVFVSLWRKVFIYADHIQVISSYLKEWCSAEGARPEKISIIPNGIDSTIFHHHYSDDEKNELRHRLGIEKDTKVLISASRLVLKNGIDILLGALRELGTAYKNYACVLLGSGPEEGRLKRYAAEHHLPVLFCGDIAHKDLPRYLAMSDIFIRPSRSEGLGSAFLEAMAVGIPIIGTPVGGIPDFLEDHSTGLFVKPEDAHDLAEKIKLLLDDQNIYTALSRNGIEKIEKQYQWDTIAKRVNELLKMLLTRPVTKKILIATGIFPPDIGGPATFSKTLFYELPRRGVEVAIITYGERGGRAGEYASVARISRKIPKGFRHIFFFAKVFFSAVSKDGIFSADASMGAGLPAFFAANILGLPFVVRVTGEYAWEQGVARFGIDDLLDDFQRKVYSWRVEMVRMLEHWLVRNATVIVVPSMYLKKLVAGWGVSEEKISCVYNAETFSFSVSKGHLLSREEAKRHVHVLDAQPMLVSAGRLVPWKGFAGLLDAIGPLVKKYPYLRLYIIGDGPEQKNLETKIKNQGLERSVFLVGRLHQDMLVAYLRAADLFVLNTGYEGFSHQLLEVLHVGTPIITTDVGGNREIIENGHNGILVEYNNVDQLRNAIEKLIRDPVLAQTFGEHGKSVTERFTKEEMMHRLREIFLQL